MSAWLNPATLFFEGEDEEALKADFVSVSARYPDRNCFEIGQYVFRGLRDGGSRGAQAARIWSEDIEIQERIRLFRINGGEEGRSINDKEQTAREILAIAQDVRTPHKERIAAYKLYSEVMGMIVQKTSNKNEDVGKPGLPVYEIARYDD